MSKRVFLVYTQDLASDPNADVDSVWDDYGAAGERASEVPNGTVEIMFLNEPQGRDLGDHYHDDGCDWHD